MYHHFVHYFSVGVIIFALIIVGLTYLKRENDYMQQVRYAMFLLAAFNCIFFLVTLWVPPDIALNQSPSKNAILLGALTFSKIEIFIKMFYYLSIRFANSELVTAKEKLEIVSGAAPPRTEKLPKNRKNIGLNHIL